MTSTFSMSLSRRIPAVFVQANQTKKKWGVGRGQERVNKRESVVWREEKVMGKAKRAEKQKKRLFAVHQLLQFCQS